MALIYNATFDSQTRTLSLLDKAGNVISSCEVPSKGNELTLTATADNSSVKLTKVGSVENAYEVNTGSGWTAYNFNRVINLNKGDNVKWRCSAHPTTQSLKNYVQFVMTGTIEASGNCNSMLSSNFKNMTSLSGYDYAFSSLFDDCTALTQAPALPATTLASSCYEDMFYRCNSLTQAPALPATNLANSCYRRMFYGCLSLTQAPALPATNLTEWCYIYMFLDCRSLKEVRIAATTSAPSALSDWLRGVSATGDFYCDPNATIFSSDQSGPPRGWRWLNINDYPN